jgi:hypothetical protein
MRRVRWAGMNSPVRVALAIAVAAVLYGVIGLPFHGVTSDSPSLFYAGDRTLFWLTHPAVPEALNFLGPEPEGFHSRFERDPEYQDPMHYPVFPGLAAAVTAQIFHHTLGWMDDIDGHHLGLILLHGFALFVECALLTRLIGQRAAVAATVALALFPSAVGHSFNNAKDWPCAQFYACAVLAAAVGLLEERGKWLVVAGVFTGLALSSKINGVFVLVTLVLWTPFVYMFHYRGRPVAASIVGGFLAIPYVAVATFFLLWPWLYYGSVPEWWAHINDYVTFMLSLGRGDRATWTAFPLKPLVFMAPPLVLGCATVYAIAGWRNGPDRKALWCLFWLWIAIPIIRIAAPGSNFHDANRHFIEYVPALCVMAGGGFDLICVYVFGWVSRLGWFLDRRSKVRVFRLGVYGLCLALLGWPIVQYAPYETTYFNDFIGGLRGAQRGEGLFAMKRADLRLMGTEGDYWYNSLRRGLQDIRLAMHGGEIIGVCGPDAVLARINWGLTHTPQMIDALDGDPDRAEFVYVMPRGVFCDSSRIERLQRRRPILTRVERGGGLIYMVLGPPH